ncbi:MAG TPA: helix-turn-helix transcriptional regulator [Bryobacteraceae bacterium]|nr:helix-turn-helix transcriptional regulator [Bryobacteraceae bacterium]
MRTSPLPELWFISNFAQRLKELRTARDMRQIRVGDLLNISPRVCSRWESGDVTPNFDTNVYLADTL